MSFTFKLSERVQKAVDHKPYQHAIITAKHNANAMVHKATGEYFQREAAALNEIKGQEKAKALDEKLKSEAACDETYQTQLNENDKNASFKYHQCTETAVNEFETAQNTADNRYTADLNTLEADLGKILTGALFNITETESA